MALPAQPLFRTRLVAGDPNRDWSYIWSVDSLPAITFSIQQGADTPIACTAIVLYYRSDWENGYPIHYGFRIPSSTPVGVYDLLIGGTSYGITITVVPADDNNTYRLFPNPVGRDRVDEIERELERGDVILAPGHYSVSRPIALTANRTITAYGATIEATPDASGFLQHMFFVQPNVTFLGGTYVPANYMFYNDNGGENLVLKDLTIRRGQLGGYPDFGLLVENCIFKHASTGFRANGMFVRCTWDGISNFNHSLLCEGTGVIGVFDCVMNDTDRGLVVRSGFGQCSDAIFCGITFNNVGRIDNGCEIITCEGTNAPGLDRCIFMHLRAYACEGDINLWESPVTNCLFADFAMDRVSIYFAGVDGSAMTDNLLQFLEMRGGVLRFSATATNNRVENAAFVGWTPTRANQFGTSPAWNYQRYADTDYVVKAEGPSAATNTVFNTVVVHQPSGVGDFSGVTVL